MSTYSSDTYSSETYATGEPAQRPHAKPWQHGFAWRSLGALAVQTSKEKTEENELETIIPIPVVQASSLAIKPKITIDTIGTVKGKSKYEILVIDKVQLEQELGEILDAIKVVEIVAKTKHRKYQREQYTNKTNREWWAQAGYCYCDKFNHVHALQDCGSK